MKHLPPPPPPKGRRPIIATPVPPPPDRAHPAHHFLEKPSVRPYLLDIQDDEFRAGHVLPKFPPAEALPRIVPEEPKPRRRLTQHLVHTLELAAVVAVFAMVVIDGRTVPATAPARTVIAHVLDTRPNMFPIEPLVIVPAAPVVSAKPEPAKAVPQFAAPVAIPKASAEAPAAPVKEVVKAEEPKTEESKTEAPAPPPVAPEDPTHGVDSPGF